MDFNNAVEAAQVSMKQLCFLQSPVQTINSFVSEKTHGKIEKLVKAIDVKDTCLALINALHFKGTWRIQFWPGATKKSSFYVSEGKEKQVLVCINMSLCSNHFRWI